MLLNRQRRVRVALPPLAKFLERVRELLGLAGRELTVCLLSDAEMARLNQRFRGKRGPTDVLSFPADGRGMKKTSRRKQPKHRKSGQRRQATAGSLAHGLSGFPSVSFASSASLVPAGDIAIAAETARRNARRFSRTLNQELRILILHGALHLAGYDHETDHGQMNRLEGRLRRRLGLA